MKLVREYARFPKILQAHNTFWFFDTPTNIHRGEGRRAWFSDELVTIHYKVSAGIRGAALLLSFTARPSSITDMA
jgi:hypothetical protein